MEAGWPLQIANIPANDFCKLFNMLENHKLCPIIQFLEKSKLNFWRKNYVLLLKITFLDTMWDFLTVCKIDIESLMLKIIFF